MLRKLKLHGELAKFVGNKEFEIEATTVGKAISFLINNFPGIEAHMGPKYYQVKVGDYDISKDEVGNPIGQEDIHLIPVISGAGRGFGRFLLGAVLIGIAIAAPGAGFMAGGGLGFAGAGAMAGKFSFAAMLGNIGIGLTLLGVSEMLYPMPQPQKFESEENPQISFSFSGVQNTSRSGTPIPIVYGEIFTGSVVISAAVDTNQIEV